MKYEEYAYHASEITHLERLLEKTPKDMTVERLGIEHRLTKAKERIEGVPVPPVPQKAYVSFRGKPVHGEYGIDANFSARAMKLFVDVVAMAAAGSAGRLESSGAIPGRKEGQPVITGTASGSFGFELELPPAGQEATTKEVPDTDVKEAVQKIQELLMLATEGSDDDLSEIADDMHPRAVRKVGEFLELLRINEARFGLAFRNRKFRFASDNQLNNTITRLAARNVHEETEDFPGTVIGVLPASRRFQLNLLADRTEIEGRISSEIQDTYELAQQYTGREVTARIRSVRVGEGNPRYTLLRVSEPRESPE